MESNYGQFYQIIRTSYTPNEMDKITKMAESMEDSTFAKRVKQWTEKVERKRREFRGEIDTDWDFPEPPIGV